MTPAQLATRKEKADGTIWVISKTDEGFRVYSPAAPAKSYTVSGMPNAPACTCPDFEVHKADTTWRCKHILAVAPWQRGGNAPPAPATVGQPAQAEVPPAADHQPVSEKRRARKNSNGSAHMLIKRSVSPDGRIDSVSVEFSMPVSETASAEIKAKALNTLRLQKEIVADFLKLNGEKIVPLPPPASKPPEPAPQNGQPVSARMIDIGKVNGRWGERFCINVQVNGRWSRIFGSADQLAAEILKTGHHIDAANIERGLRLNLPCLVFTKPSDDGKYLNVEKVLPLGKQAHGGGGDGRNIPY
jgi:hypothetical protein